MDLRTSSETFARFNALFNSATINIKLVFQSWPPPLLGAIVLLCNTIVFSETHHANSTGLVHGAHRHEGGQANGGALEGLAPAGRRKTCNSGGD